jgi:hypothetical protein
MAALEAIPQLRVVVAAALGVILVLVVPAVMVLVLLVLMELLVREGVVEVVKLLLQ